MDSETPRWHDRSASEVIAEFGVAPRTGWSEAEAAERLGRFGPNELPRPERAPAWKVFLAQFLSPLVLTLLGAAVVAAVAATWQPDPSVGPLARYSDTIAVMLIVVLNAIIGFVQERKAERALESLQAMLTFSARVLRGGTERIVPAREVVPGDIVVIEGGDHVPADVRLVSAADFRTDESPLTGESVPVEKDAAASLGSDTALADRSTMAYMGTMAVRGRATAVAVATGVRTEIGRIGKMIGGIGGEPSPLEKRMARFSRGILIACLGIAAAFFMLALVLGQYTIWVLLMTAVSLAVAAIPEGLPAITTITLALGMQRMARRGALIRRLPAVETLGSADVICTDKTGTLTQNAMQVREVATLDAAYRVGGGEGIGEGTVMRAGEPVPMDADPDLGELIRAAVVPNMATSCIREDGQLRCDGDPTEVAIVVFGARMGVLRDSVIGSLDLVAANPFHSDRRRMSVVLRDGAAGDAVSYVKGSVDEILPRCVSVRSGGDTRSMTEADRRAVADRAERMAESALRVLAFARRIGASTYGGSDEAETQLEYLGLVGMQDPPRPEAIDAIRLCRTAGVRVVMITGDHAITARAIAREMGLWEEGDTVLTGVEVERLADADLAERIPHVRIFARVTAEQKLRIVRAWKSLGAVVSMTGDGVNDAPALREADIGVAMGKGGTDVAREAAEMVLVDNNFASIVAAVMEGRRVLANIRKSIIFLLSSNIGLVVTVFFCVFFPYLLPLTPLQILWINLVTNGAPALGLGVDPPEPGEAVSRPRPIGAGLLDASDVVFISCFGVLMGAAAIVLYFLPAAWLGGDGPAQSRTIVFAYLAFAPLFHAFNCRSRSASLLSRSWAANWPLRVAFLASAGFQLVAMLIPQLHRVFRVTDLHPPTWIFLALASFSIVVVWEIGKAVRRLARPAPRAV